MNTSKILKCCFLTYFVLGVAGAHSQDLHFSQYFNAPLLVNPANTGFSPDVDWRLGVNYRNQWAAITTNPYKTMSAWGDAQLFNNTIDNGWVGIGGAILQDEAGAGGLTSTKVYGSIAYHQLLGYNSLLSTGFSAGWANERVNLSKLTFDDQWDGKFFNVSLPSDEPFVANSVNYLDLQVGVNYALFPSDNSYYNVGLSVQNLNRPSESFFSPTADPNQKIPVRYTLFLNGSFKIQDQWIVNPNIYISDMAHAYEVVLGANAHYNLSGDGSSQVIGGLYLRSGDAVIPMVGYQLKDLSITVSYDATISSLSAYDQSQGAYELSIVKTGIYGSAGKNVKCPVVKF